VPESRRLGDLAAAARSCRGCPLYRRATQTVFGKGAARASILMVGEQPGDKEDLQGAPFVGPAGAVLDGALEAAGILRKDVYLTNAVKHFKFEERGKRRIHKKPNSSEIAACRPWLEAEIDAVRPRVVVALGVTAARALGALKIPSERPVVVSTIHPSAALRAPDSSSRSALRARLARDLRLAVRKAGA
jgi:DNA polymerase